MEITGVLKLVPVPSGLPPAEVLYQVTVDEEDAVTVTEPGPHLEPLVRTGAAGVEFMIACTGIRTLRHVFPAST